MTPPTVIEEFLAQSKFSALTRQAYRDSLGRFFEAAEIDTVVTSEMGPKERLKLVTFERFAQVVRDLEKNFAPSTVGHTISAVRQFYRYLRIDDRTLENPAEGYEHKKPDNIPDWNVLHSGDSSKLLELITDLRDRAVFLALVLQGWRVSNLCALKWGDIRKEPEGLVVEFKTKRKKQIVQGLQAQVLEAAKAWAKSKPKLKAMGAGQPFIGTEDGKHLKRYDVYAIVTRYSKQLGHRVTPHGLRATYISSVISRKGIDAAKQLAGHSDISTTQRYSRWQVKRDDPLTVEDM